MNLSDNEFDQLISRAMDELPQKYIKGLNNVVIVYADDPDEHQRAKAHLGEGNILLGLYEGIPLTKRGAGYTFVLPDKITLFKNPILAVVQTETQLFEQIKRTLWHEIAHYYGLDHSRIDALQNNHDA
ncbi:metallopeptidase family protein [Candidatus Saccharibacteria bacterium]|nr:metallopeptidase family protein [Candidatus Saccharibacteria bacterium]